MNSASTTGAHRDRLVLVFMPEQLVNLLFGVVNQSGIRVAAHIDPRDCT
jgi:hypothetical protein